ncbi:MAG TPA: tetratricopeptide repeat protein [Longimicrobium sp.]|jgi:tetratricopeptide (TPR) repeat protein|nr:tetratricopeptide repeat protein [Longimicrobium sp.]
MRNLIGRFLTALVLSLSASAAAAQRRPALPAGADPNDWNSYYDRGLELLGRDGAAADELFQWAARLEPTRPEPLYARFVAFHLRDISRFGRYLLDDPSVLRDPAVVAADSLQMRALMRNPFVHRGLIALAWDQLPGNWGDGAYTRAFLAYARGDLPRAARDLEAVVRRSPRNFRVRYHFALTLANLRRYDEARVELDSVLAGLRRGEEHRVKPVYESKELLLYGIGLLYLAQNQNAPAREAFAQAVLEDASQWYVHRGLGLALLNAGNARGALDEYRTALELAGEEPLLLNEYADALYSAGQYPEAVEQLSRLVRIAPAWAAPWRALGNASLRAGRKPEAIEAFTAYLARAPRSDADGMARVRAQLEQLRAAPPE